MNKRNSYLLAACIPLLLIACGGAESDAKTAVLNSLKDPDSAKFSKFTNINDKAACLTVNARNSMGGYTGDQQASLIKQEGKWIVVGIDNFAHELCVKIMSDFTAKK